MRKVINVFLLIGTIISIGIAFRYSALPMPSFLPDGWSNFWVVSAEEQQQYSLLYDISVGFILSALFYLIVEEVPNQIRLNRAKRLVRRETNHIVWRMEQIISIVVQKYGINPNLKELDQKDFLILDGNEKQSKEEISYLTETYELKRNNRKSGIHQPSTIDRLIKDNLENILNNIAFIKNYEYFYSANYRIWNVLEKLKFVI